MVKSSNILRTILVFVVLCRGWVKLLNIRIKAKPISIAVKKLCQSNQSSYVSIYNETYFKYSMRLYLDKNSSN